MYGECGRLEDFEDYKKGKTIEALQRQAEKIKAQKEIKDQLNDEKAKKLIGEL